MAINQTKIQSFRQSPDLSYGKSQQETGLSSKKAAASRQGIAGYTGMLILFGRLTVKIPGKQPKQYIGQPGRNNRREITFDTENSRKTVEQYK